MMRKLLYVPIIHIEADMGSISSSIDKRSAAVCGRQRWDKHKHTVTAFWDQITKYFKRLDASNLKIYQDGLPADGELGQKIIREGSRQGSINYRIVLDLMDRGAEIRKTEDVALLKEEYARILKLAQNKSHWERTTAYMGHRFHKDRLLEKRDIFIAGTIGKTLQKEERGVLFLGAFHDVLPHLAKDISVKEIKNGNNVREYFKLLIYSGNEKKFNQLTQYLTAEVQGSGGQ